MDNQEPSEHVGQYQVAQGACQMNEPKKSRRDWTLILVAIVAASFLVVGIVYKYTGDFTGGATFGTSGRISSPQ